MMKLPGKCLCRHHSPTQTVEEPGFSMIDDRYIKGGLTHSEECQNISIFHYDDR